MTYFLISIIGLTVAEYKNFDPGDFILISSKRDKHLLVA